MKACLVWVTNHQKYPFTHEEVNPSHLVRINQITLEDKENFVPGFKLTFSDGYSVIVDEKDKKKVVQ